MRNMQFIGKFLGVILGSLFFHGPIGALLGFYIGHLYDSGQLNRYVGGGGYNGQQLFFDATFSIMGFVAKADGRVSERQIETAERIMRQMGLTGDKRQRAIQQFSEGKQPGFDFRAVLGALKQRFWLQQDLIRTFLEIQVQIAMSDGVLSAASREALLQVFSTLGLATENFDIFEKQSRAGYNYRHYRQQHTAHQSSGPSLSDAYDLLEVTSTASDAEVKKAYRKMMSKHHPDRLMSKGVPPEMIKMATQKTQQVKEAYEQIKASREK